MLNFLRQRLRSFRFALNGFSWALRTQPNMWLHALASVIVIALGVGLRLKQVEWLAIFIAITIVWTVECLNTSIEQLGDAITLQQNPHIKRAKDIGAAAVLVAAIGAATIGLCIFLPKIWH